MHKRRTPVQVLPCAFVMGKEYPILGVSPDARVVDPGCTDHFGLAEVKCPYTKFHVSPLDACSDPAFCMEKTSDNECCLKNSHPYYAQIQGQMGVTGAKLCDLIVYILTIIVYIFKEFLLTSATAWSELKDKLYTYYFKNLFSLQLLRYAKQNIAGYS